MRFTLRSTIGIAAARSGLASGQRHRQAFVAHLGSRHAVPPPETETEYTDRRIAATQAGIDMTNEMFPGFFGLPTLATGPQECILVMAFDFRSQLFEGMARIPTYSSWLLACDMEPAYRYHRRVLQLLQWRCPPERWWLKTPAHMHSIAALDKVYPDARFVMTHRDVGKVLPSVCALFEALSNVLTDHPDPLAIGAHNAALWRYSLERLIEFRDSGNEARFFDVSFGALQHDPMAAVAKLYGELGDDLSGDARRRMHGVEGRAGPSPASSRAGCPGSKQFACYNEGSTCPSVRDRVWHSP